MGPRGLLVGVVFSTVRVLRLRTLLLQRTFSTSTGLRYLTTRDLFDRLQEVKARNFQDDKEAANKLMACSLVLRKRSRRP